MWLDVVGFGGPYPEAISEPVQASLNVMIE
jgi:hypothetical protein